ncbi:hypothetical protein ACFO3D_13415 [Virgibacillus kekensis]|uniref:DUF4878 domain-containing protein n=1 Tax=Virgibacillus kekensis TaxID=202261 RepID=A0ABV9DK59_9BACI
MKKGIAFTAGIVLIGLIIMLLMPGITDKSQAKSAAKEVLENVIDQNYEKAFESVYFYDRATDLEPVISYKDAKEEWIQRVKDLRNNGIYIVDYKRLRVVLDDTYPVGTVDLVLSMNGKKTVKENVRLWFGERDGKWKVGDLNYNKEEQWAKLLSGRM